MPKSVEVCEGKYTFILPDKAGRPIEILHYHEAWLKIRVTDPGYKAFDALLCHALEPKGQQSQEGCLHLEAIINGDEEIGFVTCPDCDRKNVPSSLLLPVIYFVKCRH